MVSWLTRPNATTNNVGYSNRVVGSFDEYQITRWYTSFATSGVTATLDQITSVKLWLKVTAVTGSESYRAFTAQSGDSNWGTSISGDETDFSSTGAHTEDTFSISTTGWKSWTVDKNNLDLSGTTWMRVSSINEYTFPATVNITFESQNSTTQANRPYLEITYTSDTGARVIHIMCS